MNKRCQPQSPTRLDGELSSELLILPDGKILVHNLTQPMAALLRELSPDDGQIVTRVRQSTHFEP